MPDFVIFYFSEKKIHAICADNYLCAKINGKLSNVIKLDFNQTEKTHIKTNIFFHFIKWRYE